MWSLRGASSRTNFPPVFLLKSLLDGVPPKGFAYTTRNITSFRSKLKLPLPGNKVKRQLGAVGTQTEGSFDENEGFKIWTNIPSEEFSSQKIKLFLLNDSTQVKKGLTLFRSLLDKSGHKKVLLEGVGSNENSLRFLLLTVDETCLCIDIASIIGNGQLCPLDLKLLITDPRIVKVGANVEAVSSRLFHDYGLRCGPINSKHLIQSKYVDIIEYLSQKYSMEMKAVCSFQNAIPEKNTEVLDSTLKRDTNDLASTKVIELVPTNVEKPKLATMITDISQLNLTTFSELATVNIYVIESPLELEQSLQYLHRRQQLSGKLYVGFDTEGCSFQDTMGMIQIAFEDVCLLVRIHQIMQKVDKFPEILRDFLEDEHIIKVGVNLSGDVHSLNTVYGLQCKGSLDIDRVIADRFKGASSLAELTERYVEHFTLDKSHKKRTWFEETLDQQDILYAAKDAVAGYIIYEKVKGAVPIKRKIRDLLKGTTKSQNSRIKSKR